MFGFIGHLFADGRILREPRNEALENRPEVSSSGRGSANRRPRGFVKGGADWGLPPFSQLVFGVALHDAGLFSFLLMKRIVVRRLEVYPQLRDTQAYDDVENALYQSAHRAHSLSRGTRLPAPSVAPA